jgi:hypothetical protein
MITEILLIIGYIIAAAVAMIAIFNNDKLVKLEDAFVKNMKRRRRERREMKRVRIVENYLDENGLTVIPNRGARR